MIPKFQRENKGLQTFGLGFSMYSFAVFVAYIYKLPTVLDFINSLPWWVMIVPALLIGIPAAICYLWGIIGSVFGLALLFTELTPEDMLGLPEWVRNGATLIVTIVFVGMIWITHDALGF